MKAAAIPLPSLIPPAPNTGVPLAASTTWGINAIDPTGELCPPASWPCATIASTPAEETLTVCLTAPTTVITLVPLALSLSIQGAGLPRPAA